MRFLFRIILFAVLIGAALFFAPLGFRFFFLILFIFFLSRIFFWGRWRRRYGYGPRGYYPSWHHRNEIISIDGRDANMYHNTGERERKINIQ